GGRHGRRAGRAAARLGKWPLPVCRRAGRLPPRRLAPGPARPPRPARAGEQLTEPHRQPPGCPALDPFRLVLSPTLTLPTSLSPERTAMSTLTVPDIPLDSNSPAQRLRRIAAAVRVSLHWWGTHRSLSAQQKEEVSAGYAADARFLTAGKRILDVRHEAFRRLTSV